MKYTVPFKDHDAVFETDVPCNVVNICCFEEKDPDELMRQALNNLLGNAENFANFANSSKKLLFILCDGTRPTPTALVLEHIYQDIKDHQDVGFIIATGSHRGPTEEEFQWIFGRFLEEFRDRIFVHDAKNKEKLHSLGVTSRGTPVSFNKAVMEADGIVTINSVEPHYFAGYTGGRKSFLPGVAGYETIVRNHSHACEPGALPLTLEGNPISEDMFEAAKFISTKRVFSIQTVMTPENHLHSVFIGEGREPFNKAVDSAAGLYSVEISARTNIVVTVAQPPMDSNLYQSQKALENARSAIKENGIMILVSSCWDGIGDRGFYDMLSNFKDGEKISDYMGLNYKLGNHKGARMLSLSEYASIWGVTNLDDGILKPARIRGFDSLQEAVDKAIDIILARGEKPEIIVLPGGSLTVPRVVK